jgi:hypothetical protein
MNPSSPEHGRATADPQRDELPRRIGGQTPVAPGSGAGPHPAPTADAAELAMPHERDESGDTALHEGSPEVIRQAARDLEAGQVDTDLRGTAGADASARERLLEREAGRSAGQP